MFRSVNPATGKEIATYPELSKWKKSSARLVRLF
jgi:hypothetical protein